MSRYGSTDQVNVRNRKSLRQPEIPEVNKRYDIHVEMVCNPGNFIVQPYESKGELEVIILIFFKHYIIFFFSFYRLYI